MSDMTDPATETMVVCVVVVIVTSIVLGLYHFKIDPYKDAERYYFNNEKITYAVFKLAYYVILISLIFSLRFVAYRAVSYLGSLL